MPTPKKPANGRATPRKPKAPEFVPILDVESLTLGEMCDIEEVTGEPAVITMVRVLNRSLSAKGVLACAWIVRRRSDPKFSLEDAKAMLIVSLNDLAQAEPQEA